MLGEGMKNSFEDLDVWKKCREVRIAIWNLCKHFPEEENFRLSDQMIRASRSPCANIAEGHGRYHFQENIQFCRQARGSLYELIDHLTVAKECEFVEKKKYKKFYKNIESAIKLTNGYIRYLKKRRDGSG